MQPLNSTGIDPVVRNPLRHQALNSLRNAIVAGKLKPGERLRELELSAMTGVSRTVIREALRQLEAEGLIKTTPNKGAVVKALSAREAEDIYRIRARLEGLAARLFVENAPDEQVKKLATAGHAIVDAYGTGRVVGILKAKDRFYEVLFDGTGSEVLCCILGGLNAQIARWRALCLWYPQDNERKAEKSIRDIRAIVSAIQRRDADSAESLTCEHVANAAKAVMRVLRKEDSDRSKGAINLDERRRTTRSGIFAPSP